MSDVRLKGSDGAEFIPKTFSRDESGKTVHAQATVNIDPSTGLPNSATETTLSALKSSIDALSAKISACNTGAVTLDAATLAALETINAAISGTVTVSNPGLTDAQLRATAVPTSVASLPLPSGASSEATLSAINAKLPAIANGRVQVELPAGGGGLTDAELRATPVPVSGVFSATLDDTIAFILAAILEKMPRVDAADRLIVSHAESNPTMNIAAAQTLATLTTLGSMTNIGGRDASHTAYALANAGAMHIFNNIKVTP